MSGGRYAVGGVGTPGGGVAPGPQSTVQLRYVVHLWKFHKKVEIPSRLEVEVFWKRARVEKISEGSNFEIACNGSNGRQILDLPNAGHSENRADSFFQHSFRKVAEKLHISIASRGHAQAGGRASTLWTFPSRWALRYE